jgi:hypothetical protein
MGLWFTIAAGPRQRSHSQVRVPRETHNHILLSQIRDSPIWRVRSPYLYPSGTGVPFSSPSTTRRATVEVLEHASMRDTTGYNLQ